MKKIFLLIFIIFLFSCKKIKTKNIEGDWQLQTTEFVYTGMAHRNAYIFHELSGIITYHNDTDILISIKYFLPDVINFIETENQLRYYLNDDYYYTSDLPKHIKVNKTIVLCDSVTFDNGEMYFGTPNITSGICKLIGSFSTKNTFEGELVIENVYQENPYMSLFKGYPSYDYYINMIIPIKLIKK